MPGILRDPRPHLHVFFCKTCIAFTKTHHEADPDEDDRCYVCRRPTAYDRGRAVHAETGEVLGVVG